MDAEHGEKTVKLYEEAEKQKFLPGLGGKLNALRKRASENAEEFWNEHAQEIFWFKPWEKTLEWSPPFAKWFVGGLTNICYNALDRHMKTPIKNKVAYLWEGEPGERRVITYYELWREVNKFANVLKGLGLGKGDRVTMYLPMVPELPVAMLAAARLGVTHSIVFSGFSGQALAERINDSESKVVVTADGGYRRGKVVPLKTTVDEALKSSPTVKKVVVLKRAGIEVGMENGRDYWWHELMQDARPGCEVTPVESNHPLYILYTSGTTGKPKGVVHSTGAYSVWLNATMKWVFDIRPEDVYWCTADIGWVTGHSYIVYGPLIMGATSVMYEGAPDYPAPDRWWSIIENYAVTVLYTTPTAIRMFMKLGEEWPRKHRLDSLRLLGTVGEPINPEAWFWYYKVIGGQRCPIVDTWWQTETGGILISPAPGIELVPLKPGSATYALPGVDAEVVDENGKPTPPNVKGFLTIKNPWPGMLMSLWGDPERYKQVYWSRFPGRYYTGDYATVDEEGYFWLMGRADDVLKVAGHRIATMELESALVAHPLVAESAVSGKPHPVKGEAIVAFVVLRQGKTPSEQLKSELKEWIRNTVGPIAVPEEIYFVERLPKTRSGKIMRRLIRAVLSESQIGDITTLEDMAAVDEVKRAFEEFKKIVT